MLTRRTFLALPPALATLALGRLAQAEPRAGAPFPSCSGVDLFDREHRSIELSQRRTFVVAITGTDAAEPMRAWLNQAEARYGRGGPIVALVALKIGYATDWIVRSRARANTPAWRHGYVWLDRSGTLQRQVGLEDANSTPWVFVVERGGNVSVALHANVDHASAAQVWAAMSAS